MEAEDLNDSEVSDIAEEELHLGSDEEEEIDESAALEMDVSKNLLVQLNLNNQYAQENREYLKKMCTEYEKNPNEGKKFYYKRKLNMDLDTEEGRE